MQVQCGSLEYWVLKISTVPILVFATWFCGRELVKRDKLKVLCLMSYAWCRMRARSSKELVKRDKLKVLRLMPYVLRRMRARASTARQARGVPPYALCLMPYAVKARQAKDVMPYASCVSILLYMCPGATACVSSYCYVCVLILLST